MTVFPRKVDHVVFDRGWARQVVERVHPEVVDRLCLCLHDERGHVAVNYLDVGTYVPYQDKRGKHSLESHEPDHALSFHFFA
jgi:hypothetical protein